MSLQGILLIIVHAICNSSWNLLSKTGSNPIVFIRQALRFSALCYLPACLYFQQFVHYDRNYLACVVASGLAVGVFFAALSTAYHHGHISVAYPITRAVPILLVAWFTMAAGQWPSATGLFGMLLVVGGCFILPLQRFSLDAEGFHVRNYLNRSCFWALIAAVATAVFALIDKHAAVSLLGDTPGEMIISRLNYVYIQHVIAWLVVEWATRRAQEQPIPGQRPREILAGLLFLISYCLMMLALMSEPLTYAVAFRQISILITAIVSMIWIEKHAPRTRLVGLGAVFVGVVMVALA